MSTTTPKSEPQEVEVQFDFLVSSLLIFLLLFSIILSLMQQLEIFNIIFQGLKTDFDQGLYTLPSIILAIMLLLPTAFAFFFFIYGFVDILTNRFRLQNLKGLIVIISFSLYAAPLLLLLYVKPLFYVVALLYLVFILYALKNYVYFTSKEVPESLTKALDYKIPIFHFSFSFLKPYKHKILFILALFFLGKNFLFQLPAFTDALETIKNFFISITVVFHAIDSLIDLIQPITIYMQNLLSSLNLSFLQKFFAPLTLLEFIFVKLVMYLFVLDNKLSSISKVGTEKIKIGSVVSSGFLLVGLRDINLEQSIYWLSTISLLTVLMGEFFFTFVDIVTGSQLNDLFSFILTTMVWLLVLIYLIRGKLFRSRSAGNLQ